jgi:hypothetical protein
MKEARRRRMNLIVFFANKSFNRSNELFIKTENNDCLK